MGGASSGPGPTPPAGAGEGEATQTYWGRTPATPRRLPDPANPTRHPPTEVVQPHPPTEIAQPYMATEVVRPHPPTEVGQPYLPTDVAPPPPSGDVIRYGPGVPATPPASQAGLTAERVWRTGRSPESHRRPPRLRRRLGAALTVILLAASGAVLYLRFHHAPFHVTRVAISQQTQTGCGVDVTGQITTNGSAGTVSYQWLFPPDRQPPQPLSQSVVAGQHAVYVTVAVQGKGHGSASQTVILQVLGPEHLATVPTAVVVSCR